MSAADEDKKTKSPAQLIDARISELGDWRGETLARVRELIQKAVPDVVEEWKRGGGPGVGRGVKGGGRARVGARGADLPGREQKERRKAPLRQGREPQGPEG